MLYKRRIAFFASFTNMIRVLIATIESRQAP